MCEIMMTPFWIATPNSAMNPTADETFSVIPRTFRANMPPNSANGTTLISTAACRNFPQTTISSSNMMHSASGTTKASRA